MADPPLWTPDPERVAASALTDFRLRAQEVAGRPLSDYDALHAWTVASPDAFWSMLADDLLPWRDRPERVRSDDPIPDTRWFEGGRLNVVDRLLWPPGASGDDPAVIGVSEEGPRRRWSYARLRREVARVQAALRRTGLEEGDAVAAYAANVPETLALFLACAADGIVFTSGSPDFGAEAAAGRFRQVRPKLLVASPGARYGGRSFDARPTVERLVAELPDLRARVALPVPGADEAPLPEGFEAWETWRSGPSSEEPETRPLPFDHPLYVLYSSGTTGAPKAIVHRAGGALLSQLKEWILHSDARPGDRVLYYTTTGWMMWNWLVAGLGAGAAIVLVDGSPVWPDRLSLWRLAEEERLAFFGTSARYLHGLADAGVRPKERDLSSLRTIASTGSPLSSAGFRYVYEAIAEDVHLASISGGTDIVSCFLLGVPTLPVFPGQLQRPGLGVDLAVLDEAGKPVERGPGELVCRSPLPSMPLAFANDPDRSRYHAAYCRTHPGLWTHGDRIERMPEGGYVHHGRSDATLNPGGVRIGSAEVTGPLAALPAVLDAAAVPRRTGADEEIWLLVVLAEGRSLDDELRGEICRTIARGASPRHVPRRIVDVAELPRTRSGKTMELAIAEVVNGGRAPDPSSAANPAAFEALASRLARA